MQLCTAVGRHLLARRWSTPDDRLPDSSLEFVARLLTAGATAQSYREVRCGMRRPRWLRGLSAAPDTSNPIGINKGSSTLDHIEAERRLRRRVRRGHRRCTLAVRQGHGGGHRCRPQGIDHRDRSGSRAWGFAHYCHARQAHGSEPGAVRRWHRCSSGRCRDCRRGPDTCWAGRCSAVAIA
jgi:hypothetical protein